MTTPTLAERPLQTAEEYVDGLYAGRTYVPRAELVKATAARDAEIAAIDAEVEAAFRRGYHAERKQGGLMP